MANFVLVHGAAHGAWCWSRVVPILQAKGHDVIAVDLPGNGSVGDCTPLDQVDLDCYVHHVCSLLDRFQSPVVLVGHSLGGLTISQVGERRPDKICTLVYLSALLLQPGEAFRSVMSDDPKLIRQGLERDSWAISDNLAYVTFHADMARHRFYNDCSPDDVDWAVGLLVPQPTGPLMGHLEITKASFGRIPRVYIECLQDQAVLPEIQKAMYTAMPCQQVLSLDTGHSPFLSNPQGLADHLLSMG